MAKHFLLVISILFINCSNGSQKKSIDIIPRETFKSVLIDIEMSNIDFKSDTIRDLNYDSLILESILIKHKSSKEMYEKTLFFYIENPEEMNILLQEIKALLSI